MSLPILTDEFERSLGRLTANQRGLAFDFVFKLTENPAHPSLSIAHALAADDDSESSLPSHATFDDGMIAQLRERLK